ncbi:hypothetical protein C8F04DRAFT_1113753 [Mycena alexandri]|uniref:P-loop containing nucleoside triphosphate hydrolase protein n=1 Tax=Mycena alexandri TaxID=1745969 RepID=A0AAD6SN22_9AGAR|nr:hypothetical protein C8F04DRAFT_1113753 [Mycena alexandri]
METTDPADAAPPLQDQTITTRGYQQEMLDESLRKNIIIALDTGSGKTHIAVLRMKIEAEREPKKISWFVAPTRALCEQQQAVIKAAIPVSVGLISGALEPEQWKDRNLWRSALSTHRIMVTTPQVLLDALHHAYVNMGTDIGLLVFDEAHHAVDKHPYNEIMKRFYMCCNPRTLDATGSRSYEGENLRPMVLGLTASPIYGGNVIAAFRTIETNLDSTICAPRRQRQELSRYVHRPVFKHVLYCFDPDPFSTNLATVNFVFQQLNIENDPYVIGLRKKLEKAARNTPEYTRIDQQLSKAILNNKTYTHGGLQDVASVADAIRWDIGPWAADWYICQALQQAKASFNEHEANPEKRYLKGILDKIVVTPVSYSPDDIVEESSDKVRVLVECLLAEKLETETGDESYSGLVFVERRESVLALTEVLSRHPQTKDVFTIGYLVGSAGTAFRNSVLDITRSLKGPKDTLEDFKTGKKNLLISTAVAEEGIDVQACGSVIRWDPPPNMASWAQSRGRARRKRSTFTLMFEEGGAHQKTMNDWEKLERDMVALYNDPSRNIQYAMEEESIRDEGGLEFRVEATGALLTLHSAISHLNHFCAVIPNAGHVDHKPLFDIDPPELPEGWHSFAFEERSTKISSYSGPYGAKVTLPRLLPSHLRTFETERVHSSKNSAYQHAAFYAYRALYENGLLNDNLLPLTSVIEPELEEEVKALLQDVERRAGTARVSMQMDPWAPIDAQSNWYTSELGIEGLPPLLIFTRSKPPQWSAENAPILHRPGSQDSVTLRPYPLEACSKTITKAREYTRRIFWALNGSRMDWNDTDFSYLFLPTSDSDDSVWEARRRWHLQKNPSDEPLFTKALEFGEQFSFPTDLAIVRNGPQFAKAFKFVRWRFERLSDEEEAQMRTEHARFPDLEITYPLLVVQYFPPRTNFLIPIPTPERVSPPAPPKQLHLHPRLCYVTLCSDAETQYAFLLPSVLRCMAMSMTVNSMRNTLFSDLAISNVSEKLFTIAMCAPLSQEQFNYQRLETLGDTVLKFMSSLQLLGEYPLWHEGYLTQKMGHCVSNVRLAKANIGHSLYQWIIRDRLLGKKWRPKYFTPSDTTDVEGDPDQKMEVVKGKKKAKSQDLSTKVLADVVESLIGAVYLHGGFDYAFECARFFDLGIKWEPLPARIEAMLSRVETHTDLPIERQLNSVERMLGYTFTHKLLLVEALTHVSYQQDLHTISYERLEFCGDAVLDMIVTEYLYRAEGKEYSPGHMFHRKSAMVHAHILAFFCLSTHIEVNASMPRPVGAPATPGTSRRSMARRPIELQTDTQTIHLWQCLLHSSPHILDEQKTTFERFTRRREEIDTALSNGDIFPWAALVWLQAPKFLSDMVESLLGAVFVDSRGDLDVVRRVLRRLGLLPVLERIVWADVDVLHPVSRLGIWASKHGQKLGYSYVQEDRQISCAVTLDGEVVEESRASEEYKGRLSKEEVRLAAAEKAILHFRLRDVNANYATLKRKNTKSKSKKRKRDNSTGDVLRGGREPGVTPAP